MVTCYSKTMIQKHKKTSVAISNNFPEYLITRPSLGFQSFTTFSFDLDYG